MTGIERRISLEQLRSFVCVAEQGSFVAAAERLSRTQSTLTHQIQTLEDILGERLLARSRGHFGGLTPQGQQFLPHAREVLASLDSACRSVGRPSLHGSVRIGVMDDFHISGLIGLIAAFRSQHRQMEVSIVSDLSSSLKARLERGELDLALIKQTLAPGQAPSPEALQIEQLHWVSADSFRWDRATPLPVIAFHPGCAYRQLMEKKLRELNIRYRIAYAAHNYHHVRAAIRAGLGLSVLPSRQLEEGCAIVDQLGDQPLPGLGFSQLLVQTREPSGDNTRAFKALLVRKLEQRGVE